MHVHTATQRRISNRRLCGMKTRARDSPLPPAVYLRLALRAPPARPAQVPLRNARVLRERGPWSHQGVRAAVQPRRSRRPPLSAFVLRCAARARTGCVACLVLLFLPGGGTEELLHGRLHPMRPAPPPLDGRCGMVRHTPRDAGCPGLCAPTQGIELQELSGG